MHNARDSSQNTVMVRKEPVKGEFANVEDKEVLKDERKHEIG